MADNDDIVVTTHEPEAVEAVEAVETPAEPPVEGEEAAVDDEAGETDETPLRDDKGKFKKNGVQSRIDELTRKARDAERRANYYEGLATQPAQNSAEDAAKPTADQFDDYAEFVEALTDWKVAQKTQTLAKDAAKGVVQHEREANYKERLAETKAAITDFEEVMEKAKDMQIADYVGEAVFDSERGPEIFYHLAQHPEVAERLNGLSPMKAAMEIGKIEAQLSAPAAKRTSQAPAPITPIAPGSNTKVNLDTADFETYVSERRKQGARY
jgi:hypothetical protein